MVSPDIDHVVPLEPTSSKPSIFDTRYTIPQNSIFDIRYSILDICSIFVRYSILDTRYSVFDIRDTLTLHNE